MSLSSPQETLPSDKLLCGMVPPWKQWTQQQFMISSTQSISNQRFVIVLGRFFPLWDLQWGQQGIEWLECRHRLLCCGMSAGCYDTSCSCIIRLVFVRFFIKLFVFNLSCKRKLRWFEFPCLNHQLPKVIFTCWDVLTKNYAQVLFFKLWYIPSFGENNSHFSCQYYIF